MVRVQVARYRGDADRAGATVVDLGCGPGADLTAFATAVGPTGRVVHPGGIAAFAEPDWDTLMIDFPEPATAVANRRFVIDEVVRNARIDRALPDLCERSGLRAVRVIPVTAVFRDIAEADRVFGFRRVTARAVHAGYLSAAAGSAWLERLRTERLFASVSLFVTLAARPVG